VNKILDIDRCGALRQGDILMSINGRDLSVMSHLDVVEALKQYLSSIDFKIIIFIKLIFFLI
jgi:hypothetical protein